MNLEAQPTAGEIMEQLLLADHVLNVLYGERTPPTGKVFSRSSSTVGPSAGLEPDAEHSPQKPLSEDVLTELNASHPRIGTAADDDATSVRTAMTTSTTMGGTKKREKKAIGGDKALKPKQHKIFDTSGTPGVAGEAAKEELLDRINAGNGCATKYFGSYISNIVFMGMGEPLENYDEVVASIKGRTR